MKKLSSINSNNILIICLLIFLVCHGPIVMSQSKTEENIKRMGRNRDFRHDTTTVYFSKLLDANSVARPDSPYFSMKQLREASINIPDIVFINQGQKSGVFIYKGDDSRSKDDSCMVIVSGSRRYIRENVGYVKPEWFGAIGDGVSDDSKSLQKAANYLMATGGGFYWLTKPVYLTSKQIVFRSIIPNKIKQVHFSNNNKAIITSPGRSIIRAISAMESVIKMTYNSHAPATSPHYGDIQHLYIDGNKLAFAGIIFDWTIHAKVYKVSISGCIVGIQNANNSKDGSYGVMTVEECVISAETCIKVFAGDCRLTNNDLYPYKIGIYMAPWSGNTIIDKNIINNETGTGSNEKIGIELDASSDLSGYKEVRNVYIRENEFFALHHCIKATGHKKLKNNYQIHIINNHIRGADWNWNINFLEAYHCSDFLIEGNDFGNLIAERLGIFAIIFESDRIKIVNNNIQNTKHEAIRIVSSSQCIVNNNIMQKIGDNLDAGIILYGAASKNRFEGNKLLNPDSGYCYFFIKESDNCNDNFADNNIVSGIKQIYRPTGNKTIFIERIYQQGIPDKGYHLQGAVVINPKAKVGAPYQWLCIESGTPGKWKIISVISSK